MPPLLNGMLPPDPNWNPKVPRPPAFIPDERKDGSTATLDRVLTRVEEIAAGLARIETQVSALAHQSSNQEHFTTAQVAKMLGKAEFTVREWCRKGRIKGEKTDSGRGKHPAWVISRDELARYRKAGLLPLRQNHTTEAVGTAA